MFAKGAERQLTLARLITTAAAKAAEAEARERAAIARQ